MVNSGCFENVLNDLFIGSGHRWWYYGNAGECRWIFAGPIPSDFISWTKSTFISRVGEYIHREHQRGIGSYFDCSIESNISCHKFSTHSLSNCHLLCLSFYPIQKGPSAMITSRKRRKKKTVSFVDDGDGEPKPTKLANLVGSRSPIVTRGRKKKWNFLGWNLTEYFWFICPICLPVIDFLLESLFYWFRSTIEVLRFLNYFRVFEIDN